MYLKKPILILLFIIVLPLFCSCNSKPVIISQEQMVYAQINMGQNMYPIVNSMADVYSAYLAFNKSESDFLKDIKSLRHQYDDLENSYVQFNKKYQIENPDEKVIKAVECMEKARHAVGTILNNSVRDGKVIPRADLLKLYVEQGSIIQQNIEEFKKIVMELYKPQSQTDK